MNIYIALESLLDEIHHFVLLLVLQYIVHYS
jgi:hypothetical protein